MPSPQALPIRVSQRQKNLLLQIVRRTTNPHRLVRRAKLILAAASGVSNAQITLELELERGQVRQWRQRWLAATPQLREAESQGISDRKLRELITFHLSDRIRPGTASSFSTEQVVQIVALACENPEASGYPVSHWSPTELANEAVKRGIVDKISSRSIGRFLKRSDFTAASSPLLAQC